LSDVDTNDTEFSKQKKKVLQISL